MIREYDFYGILIHPYMLALICSFAAIKPVGMLLNRVGMYRRVWHAGLFDTAVFLILYGVFVCLLIPDLIVSLFV